MQKAWIIITKMIRGRTAAEADALHNFIPICHLSRSRARVGCEGKTKINSEDAVVGEGEGEEEEEEEEAQLKVAETNNSTGGLSWT